LPFLSCSADDWGYAVKHFIEKHPEDVVVHCSGCNSATRTFDGIDVMGRRLAEEVISVVECRPELKKISFVAHSLGGLIARYAIALLYENETAAQTDYHEEYEKDVNHARSNQPTGRGKIAGLEPMNFITFVTPHLGTRSHKQIPLLHGSYKLEKMAFRMSWIAGRSGKHLFLKDIEDEKPPLLLQMVTDYGDLHFMYAIYMLFYMNCHKIRSHCLTKTGACNIHYLSIYYTSFRMQISSPFFQAPCCLLECIW